jgi:tight adherence protein B
MGRVRSEPGSEVAEVVLQLAVLLETGMAPARAWEYLASTGEPAALRVVSAHQSGLPLADAIERARPIDQRRRRRGAVSSRGEESAHAWRDVAAAWKVATTVGSPLAPSLRALSAALSDRRDMADEVVVALAEPAGTARLMGWLPLVAIGLGLALGFDTLAILFTTPLGIACLVAGLSLVLIGRRWTRSLTDRAAADAVVPGLTADLLAIALGGGVSMTRALRLVGDAGFETDAATDTLLEVSRSAGVPARELLRASGVLARHRARIEGRMRAAKLSTRLLLPLGVCTLPAFLLLGVAPMLLGVMSTMTLRF